MRHNGIPRPSAGARAIRTPNLGLCLLLGPLLGSLMNTPAGAADPEWPNLARGEWHFIRMMNAGGKPTTIERTACVDPVAEWKKQQEASIRSGCKVTMTKPAVDRYIILAICDIAGVGKGVSRSTAIVRDSDNYQVTVENEGVVARTGAREQLVAKRLGDCLRRGAD